MSQKCQYQPKAVKTSAILLQLVLLIVTIATVASVPTSVLAQNTELSSANNDIESLNKLKLKSKLKNIINNNNNNFLLKVKRSSNGIKNAAAAENNLSSATTTTTSAPSAANNGLEKKSSPEVVPALYNAPPPSSSKSSSPLSSSGASSGAFAFTLPDNPVLMDTAMAAGLAAAANQYDPAQLYETELNSNVVDEIPAALHKRGISFAQQQQQQQQQLQQLPEQYLNTDDDVYYANSYLPAQGVWANEIDPAVGYAVLQDWFDYMTPAQRSSAPSALAASNSNRLKGMDDFQNLQNSDAYFEPLPYSNRYYADSERNKRTNSHLKNFAGLRKKLTPADMLALVALVEADKRERTDVVADDDSIDTYADADTNLYNNRKYYNGYGGSSGSTSSNMGLYDYPAVTNDDDLDAVANDGVYGNFYEPAADAFDVYGTPVNYKSFPKYEVQAPNDQKYGSLNRFAVKRFMVAKKNRPLGEFFNAPVAKPRITFIPNAEQYF